MKEKSGSSIKLADVAKFAGISTSTVSRVLNNQPGISPSTRSNVREAIRSLGYKPELLDGGATVRDSRTRIDVVICPLSEQKNPMGLDYYGVVMAGIRSAVDSDKFNLKLNILPADSPETICSDETAGVLLVGNPTPAQFAQLKESRVPFVIHSNNWRECTADLVTVDKFTESTRVCDYLVELGIKKVVLLMPAIDTIYCEGFRCGMARHGIAIPDSAIYLARDTDHVSYVAPIHRLLEMETFPEALVTASYTAADFFLEMVQAKGLRMPDTTRIVAFTDGSWEDNPDFITVRYDIKEIGYLAMERLLQKIANPCRKNYRIAVPATLRDPRNNVILQ